MKICERRVQFFFFRYIVTVEIQRVMCKAQGFKQCLIVYVPQN